MASYLDQIKAADPAAYAKIAKLAQYTANDKFGGQIQDYQAQIFTPLSADVLAKANSTEGRVRKEDSTYLGDGQYDYNFTGYTKDLGKVNGVPVTAVYDTEGKLTGYQGDTGTRSFIDGQHSVSGAWDASGKPVPQSYSSKGGGVLGSIAGELAGGLGGYLPTLANLVLPGAGLAISGANAALNGGDLGGLLKNLAISQAIGQSGLTGSVADATGSQALGQLVGNTGAGLLSGQDFGTSLTNAAINTGANQAASGLLSTPQASPTTFTPSAPYEQPATDYSLTSPSSTGGLGLQADLAPTDTTSPYSFNTNYANTGGLGLQSTLAPLDISNPYALSPIATNLDSMGGGTGIQVPSGANATLGSIGTEATTAANEAQPSGNPTDNTAGTGLLASLIKSVFTGNPSTGSSSTGTGNMATTDTNNLLGSLFGGALTSAGGLMQGSTNAAAAREQANALRQAGSLASQQAQFRPVGTTTTFGTSNFQVDPTTGQLTSAGYQLSPQLQAYQDQIMGSNRQSLTDAANLQNLGRGYIAQSPEAAAQQYMTAQQALLQPSRDTESARLANQLQQTGRTGISVAQGGTLGMANPEQQALANARAMQDLQLAAQAQQQGRAQTTFGQGLLTSAYDPFNAGLKTSSTVESLGQQPFGLSTGLAQQSAQAGSNAGRLGLAGNMSAADAALKANQYNPFASIVSGLGGSSLFGQALGNVAGNTSIGSSLAQYLASLGGNDAGPTGNAYGDISNNFVTDQSALMPSNFINPNYNTGAVDAYGNIVNNNGWGEG
jgi:hypothetical protein